MLRLQLIQGRITNILHSLSCFDVEPQIFLVFAFLFQSYLQRSHLPGLCISKVLWIHTQSNLKTKESVDMLLCYFLPSDSFTLKSTRMKNHVEPPPKDLLQVQCSKGFNLRLQRSDFYSVAAGLGQMMATTSAIDAVEHIAVTTSRANIGAWSSQTQIRQRSCGHRWTGHDRHGRHRRHRCRHRRRKSRTEKGRTGCEWLFEGIGELQQREVRGFWPWRSHQVLF